jgi:hypothetical protein
MEVNENDQNLIHPPPPTTETQEDDNPGEWFVIPCPNSINLTAVDKERGTHGSVYALWEVDCRSPLWIGQSIPALVRSVNEKAVWTLEKRLHASSLYRCLRGESRKLSHKSWRVEKYSRSELVTLNSRMKGFPSVVCVSKSPEMWQCNTPQENQIEDTQPEEKKQIDNFMS